MALRWILMNEAVTAAIPGAKTPEQARANAAAADLAPLPPAAMERIARLYADRIRPLVHQRW
jgi:aryl-alcohol dehydrogenase-like predicted oxidoreductase